MDTVAYEELLKKDGRVVTHVVGTSMLPLLRNRESIVIVESCDKLAPRRGDVVLYKVGGAYILHRVLRIRPEEYLTRGDNTFFTEHIPVSAVLAVMTGFYRRPKGRLIRRDDALYVLYRTLLPCIRLLRRLRSFLRRVSRRLARSFSRPAPPH